MIDYEGYEGSNNSNCVMNEQSDTHMIQTARLDFSWTKLLPPRRTWLLLEGPISHDAARGRAGSHRRAPLRGIVRGAGRPAGRRARAGRSDGSATGSPRRRGESFLWTTPEQHRRRERLPVVSRPSRPAIHRGDRTTTRGHRPERGGELRRGAGRRPRGSPAGPRDAHCPAHLRDGRTRRSGATSPGRAGSHDDDDDDDDGGCDAPAHDARAPSRIYG